MFFLKIFCPHVCVYVCMYLCVYVCVYVYHVHAFCLWRVKEGVGAPRAAVVDGSKPLYRCRNWTWAEQEKQMLIMAEPFPQPWQRPFLNKETIKNYYKIPKPIYWLDINLYSAFSLNLP